MKKILFLLVILPLLLSIGIYTFFRSDSYAISMFVHFLVDAHIIEELGTEINEYMSIPPVLVGSLPSAFWVFSTTLISTHVNVVGRLKRRALALLPFLFAFGMEIFQYVGFTDGTFDFYDIHFSILGLLAGLGIGTYINRSETYFNIPLPLVSVFYLILMLGNVY